jgi:hypothetical protein
MFEAAYTNNDEIMFWFRLKMKRRWMYLGDLVELSEEFKCYLQT